MKINYARLYNLGNYENERIEVEDEVMPGETFGEALQRLASIVATEVVELRKERRQRSRLAPAGEPEPEF